MTLADETKIGFWDLTTEQAHPESPEHLPALLEAVAGWKADQNKDVPPMPPPLPMHRTCTRHSLTLPPIEPRTPVALHEIDATLSLTADVQDPPARPWIDLTTNRAGDGVRDQARAAREAAPVKSLLARALGVHTDERAWRIGADGEEKVAAQLAKAARKDPRWQFIHAIPVGKRGSDIDHLIVGPGGVFTVTTKHHAKAKIWVGGNTFMVNGHNQPYIRNSRHEATRAAKLLTDACGFPDRQTPHHPRQWLSHLMALPHSGIAPAYKYLPFQAAAQESTPDLAPGTVAGLPEVPLRIGQRVVALTLFN